MQSRLACGSTGLLDDAPGGSCRLYVHHCSQAHPSSHRRHIVFALGWFFQLTVKLNMNLTKPQRANIKSMYSGCCAYCGDVLGDKWHADHVVPVRRESVYKRGRGHVATGKLQTQHDNMLNLKPACVACNINKYNLTLEQWRKALQSSCAQLRKYSGNYKHALRFGLITEHTPLITFHFERRCVRKRLT